MRIRYVFHSFILSVFKQTFGLNTGVLTSSVYCLFVSLLALQIFKNLHSFIAVLFSTFDLFWFSASLVVSFLEHLQSLCLFWVFTRLLSSCVSPFFTSLCLFARPSSACREKITNPPQYFHCSDFHSGNTPTHLTALVLLSLPHSLSLVS
jgi:hypothetical protein